MKNQRKYERFDLTLSVSLKDKQGLHPMKSGNISKYGLFLESTTPKPVRQLIQLVIEFPQIKDTVEVLAQVMWSDATGKEGRSGGRPGMGVKFFSFPEKERRKWEGFVEMVRGGKVEVEKPEVKKADSKEGVIAIGEEELEELEGLEGLELEEVKEGAESEEPIAVEAPMPVHDLSNAITEIPEDLLPVGEAKPPTEETERRDFPRKPVSFLVKMKDVDTLRSFFTRDISLGGMFLATSIPKKPDDVVEVIIVHPWTEEEFPIQARVVRVEYSDSGRTTGLALEFLKMNDTMRDSLLTYIESGFVISIGDHEGPIEGEVIKFIEKVEAKIKANPIESRLHYEVGLLYLCLSDWERAFEHLDIAQKLGYAVPDEVMHRLEGKV